MKNYTKRSDILGVRVNTIPITSCLSLIDTWIRKNKKQYVCATSVHGIIEAQKNPRFKKILNNSGLTTPDGMPLVWISKLQGYKNVERVYGPDLLLALCQHSVKKRYKHFFYGSSKNVLEKLTNNLKKKFPGILIVGTKSPPFRPLTLAEDKEIIKRINRLKPDILWVGLSTPKQEQWIADHRKSISAPVMLSVGAAFDFHAGTKQQAPLWMQHAGLEWFFRMCNEPSRLTSRYMTIIPQFLMLLFIQFLSPKKYKV